MFEDRGNSDPALGGCSMTEAQAERLAWAIVENRIFPHIHERGLAVPAVEAIKLALMNAYNDGWEVGFEEGRNEWR